jgi:microcystin-dependent protein
MKKLVCVAALVAAGLSGVASAQEKYLGEVFITAGMYCPNNTYEASGQILSINQHTALFAVLGASYGGDGQNTFGLPDLRGRVPVGVGNGRGLANIVAGEMSGQTSVTLLPSNAPPHLHPISSQEVTVRTGVAGSFDANGDEVEVTTVNSVGPGNTVQMSGIWGQGLPIDIRTPYVGMRYCIVNNGLFPTRP